MSLDLLLQAAQAAPATVLALLVWLDVRQTRVALERLAECIAVLVDRERRG